MKMTYFRYGYREGREVNLRVGKWQARLAQHQVALWSECAPIFNLLF